VTVEWGDGTRSEVRFDCLPRPPVCDPLTGNALTRPGWEVAIRVDGALRAEELRPEGGLVVEIVK
jgi:hypothetical protein